MEVYLWRFDREQAHRYQCRRPGLWFINDNGRGVDSPSKPKYVGVKAETQVEGMLEYS
jgi:hypothetical protein